MPAAGHARALHALLVEQRACIAWWQALRALVEQTERTA